MPGFDNSAVDGFGIRLADVERASEDSPARLELSGTIQAGDRGAVSLAPGSALKILTGAVVPPEVEAVVMREFCEEQDGLVLVKRPSKPGENIRRRGEEFKAGEQILAPGTPVTPPVIGLLASTGHASFTTYKKPSVTIISTGDELVDPGQPLAPGQIYDSNSFALEAAVTAMAIDRCTRFHTRDNRDSTRDVLSTALDSADVVISAGGVSVGDFDFVKDVSEQLGIETIFWRIALKPGKPVYFGRKSGTAGGTAKLVFGLPGNPVSALVTFHQLVKPALLKILGRSDVQPLELRATLTRNIRKKAGRMEFVRGIAGLSDGTLYVEPTPGQESHMMGGLAPANCLIVFPLEEENLPEGQQVRIDLLDWSDL
jgi:molybdopterin molybdotransferase